MIFVTFLSDLVSEIKEKYVLPSSEDYSGAIQALHRLSDTYLLNPKEIRLGNLSQNYPSRPLNGILAVKKLTFYINCFKLSDF